MAEPLNKIRHVGGADKAAYTYYPVVVIGAGESGIAMGCRLRQVLGFDQFRIFDRKSGLGGTWHANKYPGIACDVPAILYSYSFAQNAKWTSPFPSGNEIVQYLYDVCEHFQLLDKIQLNTSIKSMVWIENDEEWEVILEHLAPGVGDLSTQERKDIESEKGQQAAVLRTEKIRAKIVVSAVGGLVEPKPFLDVPGMESFEGQIVHTASWDTSIDLRNKDVVVVGSGCSAAQVIPQLIKPEYGAKHVTELMRSPPWAVPFLPEKATETWKQWMPWLCKYIPGFQFTFRKLMFTVVELEFVSLFSPTEGARERRKAKATELLAYMRKMVPEEYHEILIPNYEVFCKRRVVDEGWFKSLQAPNVEITTLPLTSMQGKTLTLGPGRHYPPMSQTASTAPTSEKTIPCDVLIMANGYQTNQWLHPLDITGRHGQTLYKTWDARGGAQAYLGTAMDGFPNFYILFGPNTATGHSSVILASENMTNYALNFIAPVLRGDVRTYEVKESAERRWTADLQHDLKNSVFMTGGCNSWYVGADGWNSTVYPRTQVDFTLRCMFPRWSHWNAVYTRKGLWKARLRWILRAFGTLAVLVGVVYRVRLGAERSKELVASVLEPVRETMKSGLRAVAARV